ncbi:MAG: hypothetical protein ACI90V_009420, partial [Bacillariaceae sp.]
VIFLVYDLIAHMIEKYTIHQFVMGMHSLVDV